LLNGRMDAKRTTTLGLMSPLDITEKMLKA